MVKRSLRMSDLIQINFLINGRGSVCQKRIINIVYAVTSDTKLVCPSPCTNFIIFIKIFYNGKHVNNLSE